LQKGGVAVKKRRRRSKSQSHGETREDRSPKGKGEIGFGGGHPGGGRRFELEIGRFRPPSLGDPNSKHKLKKKTQIVRRKERSKEKRTLSLPKL